MATTKFLDLAGLELLVDNIKTLVSSSVSNAELKGAEFDNTTGKISLTKGEGSVDVSLDAVNTLTGDQMGLLKASDYAAMQNVIEGVAIQVGNEAKPVTIQDKTALIEYLSAIPDNVEANNLYKAPNAKAVVDYVGAQFTEKMEGQATEDYVNSTVTSAFQALTKAYEDADAELSETLTTAYGNAILQSAANIKNNYEAADAVITSSYTQLVAETKEALQQEIDNDVNALKQSLKKEDTATAGQYVSAVSQSNGVITVSRANLPVYTLVKDKTSENGYKYHLAVDGVQSGDAIDIKDMVVSGGGVSTHEDGKTYLDLTIANGETVSIPADSLVDTYTAGDDRIIVGDYAISLNLANLTRDLVKDNTMLGTFATVSSVQKVADDLSTLDGKVTEHLTTANNTYATKDEALTSLSELTTTGAINGTAYSASFKALDVKGNTHSTVTFDLVLKSDIDALF